MAEKKHGPFFGTVQIDLTGFSGDFTVNQARAAQPGVTVVVGGLRRGEVKGVKVSVELPTLFVTDKKGTPARKAQHTVALRDTVRRNDGQSVQLLVTAQPGTVVLY